MTKGAVFAAAFVAAAGASLAATPATTPFTDGAHDAKVHAGSGFICPLKIGEFERDAVGQSDPQSSADFCTYSALDGVYGTVTLKPVSGAYDARASLAREFAVQEGSGAKKAGEGALKLGNGRGGPLEIYTRDYETSALEDLHYRVLFTGAAFGDWAVETTVEYADPRDTPYQREFLETVYRAATAEIAQSAGAPPPSPPPVATAPGPR